VCVSRRTRAVHEPPPLSAAAHRGVEPAARVIEAFLAGSEEVLTDDASKGVKVHCHANVLPQRSSADMLVGVVRPRPASPTAEGVATPSAASGSSGTGSRESRFS
jgi:hypothetical protein